MSWSNGEKISLEKIKLDIQTNPKGRKAFNDFKRKPYGMQEHKPFEEVLKEEIKSEEESHD